MWTDVIAPFRLQTQPDALAANVRQASRVLPRDIVGVDWRYRDENFFVAPRLRDAGYQAFTAPAARSSGDVFNLPRLRFHTTNIRGAFLRAVEWRLLGTILTSWSYRGSPHEVCLAEYVGAAYGWNAGEPDVPALLTRFFQQRYGLPEVVSGEIVQAALAETADPIPTALGKPVLDVERRAWTIPAEKQADQLIDRLGREQPTRLIESLQTQRRLFAKHDELWRSALRLASRHRSELQSWDLSRRHLAHRLELSAALARLKSGGEIAQELRELAETRGELRSEWKALYREAATPLHMEVELDIRFDAEPGIVEAVRRWEEPAL
jgi:hypothetical protein